MAGPEHRYATPEQIKKIHAVMDLSVELNDPELRELLRGTNRPAKPNDYGPIGDEARLRQAMSEIVTNHSVEAAEENDT